MDLDYADALPADLVRRLEEAARSVGLPLVKLELLGQDPEHARAFVEHVGSGTQAAFLGRVDWAALSDIQRDREQTSATRQAWAWVSPDEARV